MTDKEQLTKLYECIKVLEDEKVNEKYIESFRKQAKALENKLYGA